MTASGSSRVIGASQAPRVDWSGAESEFKLAIKLNPNYPPAHQWYAVFLRTMGRFDDAMVETRKTQQLDRFRLA
jgi:Flp pilus assembly protein TadD